MLGFRTYLRPTKWQKSSIPIEALPAAFGSGLFIGQSKEFFTTLQTLAEGAEAAVRQV
jgi:hypothetical protein